MRWYRGRQQTPTDVLLEPILIQDQCSRITKCNKSTGAKGLTQHARRIQVRGFGNSVNETRKLNNLKQFKADNIHKSILFLVLMVGREYPLSFSFDRIIMIKIRINIATKSMYNVIASEI